MTIDTSYEAGRLKLFLRGEIDHHSAKEILNSIDELLDEYIPRECVVDMGSVSFMDSSGIAIMLRLGKRMKIMGGRACLENPSRQALRVIEASGLERYVPVSGCGCLKEA